MHYFRQNGCVIQQKQVLLWRRILLRIRYVQLKAIIYVFKTDFFITHFVVSASKYLHSYSIGWRFIQSIIANTLILVEMKNNVLICMVALIGIGFISCGPRDYKKYNYTISGTIYADRQTKKPLSNLCVDIIDLRYNEYTYGTSTLADEYYIHTDENGYFSLELNSSKIYTEISAAALYDVRADSIVTDSVMLAKRKYNLFLGEDSCFCETREFFDCACEKDIDRLENLEIYLAEYPSLVIEPKSFTRKQVIHVRNDNGLAYVKGYDIRTLSRKDSLSPYSYISEETWRNAMHYDGVFDIQLNIPDSVPSGYYFFRLLGHGGYTLFMMEPDCIIQLVDDPADN